MEIINIALCDDDSRLLLSLAVIIEELFKKYKIKAEVERFNHPESLLKGLEKKKFDFIFLDINMPDLDGIEVGKRIKERDNTIEIVYVSSYEERVFETFSVRPFGFIRKSKFKKDSEEIISSIKNLLTDNSNENYVDIKTNSSIRRINVQEVVYIDSQKDYQYLHILNKEEPIRIRSGMKTLEDLLAPYHFIRIHKGILINCIFIRRIDNDGVILVTDEILPVSRRKAIDLRIKYLEFGANVGRKIIK